MLHDFSIWLIIWQNFTETSSFRISNAMFHCLWALCCYWEVWGASDSDTLWLSLEAHRICILPFWKLLSFILGRYFFTSDYSSNILFFFGRVFLYFAQTFWFFPNFCDFSNFHELYSHAPFLKKLHPFAVFIFCYLSGDITERCLFFFFLVSPRQCLFPPYSFFYCLFYII